MPTPSSPPPFETLGPSTVPRRPAPRRNALAGRSRTRAKTLLLLTFALLSSGASRATGPFEPSVYFEHIGREEGLSHFTVLDVLQDRRGFVWFATRAGLDRYDGHDVRSYRSRPGVPGTLSHSRISCLLEDRAGTLWVGTDGGGINRMVADQESFEAYLPDPERGIGEQPNRVTSMAEAPDGTLWLSTFGGAFRFDPSDASFVAYPPGPGGLATDRLFVVHVAPDGEVWFGGDAGLESLDPVTGAHRLYAIGTTTAIVDDAKGGLWVGASDQGLYHLGPASEAPGTVDRALPQKVLAEPRVRDLFPGRQGMLWMALATGLGRFDPRQGELLEFRPDPLDPGSLSYENVTAVIEDDAGIVWAATWGGGVNKLDGRAARIRRARHRPGRPGSLSQNEVMSILEDRRGRLWIGTWKGGLNRLDPGAQGFTAYRAAPEVEGRLASDTVTALYEDRKGRLWIGTRGGGIHLYDETSDRFRAFPQVEDPRARVHMIHSIAEDPKGRLFLGTSGGGLVRFDPETRTFVRFDRPAGGPRSLGDDDAWALLPTDDGLWVGTSAGLRWMDWETERFTAFRSTDRDPASLPLDRVNCLLEDRDGHVWVGTDGGGLARVERSASGWTVRRYGEREGLSSRQVKSVLEDRVGALWIATDRGFSRFDSGDGTTRNFGAGAGAQRGGYMENSATVGRDGTLYLGGLEGMTAFDPGDLGEPLPAPRVVLTELLVGNRAVAVSTPEAPSPIDRPIDRIAELAIGHDQFPLAFEFALLQYAQPDQQRYLYRLDPFDRDWIATDASHRRASYSGLAPGQYTFRVRAANAEGVWSEDEARIALRVETPWWRTWWARGGSVALLVSLVFASQWVRLRRSERMRDELETRVEERTAELAQLVELTERINGAITIDEVLDHAYESLRSIAPYDRIGLALLDEQRIVLRAVWSRGEREATGIGVGYEAPLEGSSLQAVLESGRPRILPDVEAHLAEHPDSESTRRILSEGVRSSLTCPLTALGRPIGFIFLSSFAPHTYTEKHADFMMKMAGHLSLIVGKSQLHDDLVKTKEQLETANRELESMAATDPLTGLANRRAFSERITADWSRCLRSGAPLSCLMIDVDRFKAYNDHHGHAAGDDCLRTVAETLSEHVRRASDLASRYGGEEFCVLLFGCHEEEAAAAAEALRAKVEARGIRHEASAPAGVITVSIGYATAIPRPGDDPAELVAAADRALYRAKTAGRNRVERAPYPPS